LAVMTVYTYEQIKQIKQSTSYTLPDTLYAHVKKIVSNAGFSLQSAVNPKIYASSSLSSSSSSGFQNYAQQLHQKKRNKAREIMDNSEWERAAPANAYPEFKETTLSIKSATGLTSVLGNIKLLLNKLNRDKYDDLRDQIMTEIHGLVVNPASVRAFNDVFLNVVSSNDFHSEVYARLYDNLLDEFDDTFDELFDEYVETFLNNMDFEECPDSDTNYDEYCNYVSRMKRRVAVATFLKYMVLHGRIEKFKVYNYLDDLIQNVITPNLDNALYVSKNEDALKLMAVFYKKDVLDQRSTSVQNTVNTWSKFVLRQHAGLGNKGIFALKEMVAKYEIATVVLMEPSKKADRKSSVDSDSDC